LGFLKLNAGFYYWEITSVSSEKETLNCLFKIIKDGIKTLHLNFANFDIKMKNDIK
jgi:hypothetical protein